MEQYRIYDRQTLGFVDGGVLRDYTIDADYLSNNASTATMTDDTFAKKGDIIVGIAGTSKTFIGAITAVDNTKRQISFKHPKELFADTVLNPFKYTSTLGYKFELTAAMETIITLAFITTDDVRKRIPLVIEKRGTASGAVWTDDGDTLNVADFIQYIDLFASSACALIAFVYALNKNELPPDIAEKINDVLNERLYSVYLGDAKRSLLWWTGNPKSRRQNASNWSPWCAVNCLSAIAFHTENEDLLTKACKVTAEVLDYYANGQSDDGWCVEGVGYWTSGHLSFTAGQILIGRLCGQSLFGSEFVNNILRFPAVCQINREEKLNFSDNNSFEGVDWGYLELLLSDTDSEAIGVCDALDKGDSIAMRMSDRFLLKNILLFTLKEKTEKGKYPTSRKYFFPNAQAAVTQEAAENGINKGLYLAIVGGHNEQPHNHFDVGSFIVYDGEQPLFVDLGKGNYTARSFDFSARRTAIINTMSNFHNVPKLGRSFQWGGHTRKGKVLSYNGESGRVTYDLSLLYHEHEMFSVYEREAELIPGEAILISDKVMCQKDNEIKFSLITTAPPEDIGIGYFKLHGRLIEFDDSLTLEYEDIYENIPEAQNIARNRGCETLYRIRLTGKVFADTEKTYLMKIYKKTT